MSSHHLRRLSTFATIISLVFSSDYFENFKPATSFSIPKENAQFLSVRQQWNQFTSTHSRSENTEHKSLGAIVLPPQRNRSSLCAKSSYYGRSNDDEDDKNEEESDSFYNILGDENKNRPNEERRRVGGPVRDRMKRILRKGSVESDVIKPIRLDGSTSEDDESGDEDMHEQNVTSRKRDTLKLNFETLFEGMPALDNIISNGPLQINDTSDSESFSVSDPSQSYENPPMDKKNSENIYISSLTPEDISEIDLNFKKFSDEMREELDQMKKSNPEAVPENAEFLLNQVVEEQRNIDLRARGEKRAMESFAEYEKQLEENMKESLSQSQDIDGNYSKGTSNPIVEEIINDAEDNFQRNEAIEESVNNFRAYEESLRSNLAKNLEQIIGNENLDSTSDFDRIQLRLMEKLLMKRNQKSHDAGIDDEDLYLTDNIEDGIKELQAKVLAKNGEEGFVQPDTMKEWQVYRAIATKMENRNLRNLYGEEYDDISEESMVDLTLVGKQLQAWKELQQKEQEMRINAGLTVGVRMPFEWSDKDSNEGTEDSTSPARTKIVDKKETEMARSEMDDIALSILHDLMAKTKDPYRRRKIQVEIEELKEEIEARRLALLEEEERLAKKEKDSKPLEPMMISDFLGKKNQKSNSSNVIKSKSSPSQPFFMKDDESLFSSNVDEGDTILPSNDAPPLPSPTNEVSEAYISNYDGTSSHNFDEELETFENESQNMPSLGTFKEQKFRSLVARSGARTVGEQEDLRTKWEEFQEAEQQMREKTGLSESNSQKVSGTLPDVSEFIKDDGDIDAEKILASLKQRPKRRKIENADGGNKDNSYEEFLKYEEQMKAETLKKEIKSSDRFPEAADTTQTLKGNGKIEKNTDDVIIHQNQPTKWGSSDISDQMYRSVAAGIQTNEKNESKASYKDLLDREEVMRRKIQNLNKDFSEDDVVEMDENALNSPDYVENILSSIGPRPTRKMSRLTKGDEVSPITPLEGQKGKISETNKDQRQNGKPMDGRKSVGKDAKIKSTTLMSEQMPDWLRREMEEKRGEEFILSESDALEYDAAYEFEEEENHEENQRQAELFEQKYSNAPKEINIGEVLDRTYFGPDDYGDDFSNGRLQPYSDLTNFEARKANLLEYTVLNLEDINAVMEYKTSSRETGLSPFLRKVNSPFSQFGVIFWLEGVIMDISGLQFEAWKKTAEEFDFKYPTLEDVKYAATHSAEFSVRRIFYWTDDFLFGKDIAKSFRENFRIIFNTYLDNGQILHHDTYKFGENANRGDMSSADENYDDNHALPTGAQQLILTDSEIIDLQSNAWRLTAFEFGYHPPTMAMIEAAKIFSPEVAIEAVFEWMNDNSKISEISKSYKRNLSHQVDLWKEKNNVTLNRVPRQHNIHLTNSNAIPEKLEDETMYTITDEDLLELDLYAWNLVAQNYQLSPPSKDTILLASWVEPERAIKEVFEWDTENVEMHEIVSLFKCARCDISKKFTQKNNLKDISTKEAESYIDRCHEEIGTDLSKTSNERCLQEYDVYNLHLRAWEQVAGKFNFNAPTIEQVQTALFLGADKAIPTVFKWTENFEECEDIVLTFQGFLKELSSQLPYFTDKKLSISKSSSDEEQDILPVILNEEFFDFAKSLKNAEMPLAVISYLENDQLDALLRYAGLSEVFAEDNRVSATCNYNQERVQLLGASLRVERRPDHCVVFGATPQSSVAAHEVDMKSVTLVQPYSYFELNTADMTSRFFSDISKINIRNLFSNNMSEEPMLQLQEEAPRKLRDTLTWTKHWDDGD